MMNRYTAGGSVMIVTNTGADKSLICLLPF